MYDMIYRYYVAQINEKGTVKCIQKNWTHGPYYDQSITIRADGYDTEEEAIEAVKKHMKMNYDQFKWASPMDIVIVKQLTIRYEEEE